MRNGTVVFSSTATSASAEYPSLARRHSRENGSIIEQNDRRTRENEDFRLWLARIGKHKEFPNGSALSGLRKKRKAKP